jgi:hypothetical protein
MRDTLFVFKPGFHDKGNPHFCPYSAQVIGFLAYYPQVRETLDIIEIGWDKPREPLASLLGEAHQSAPILVLGSRVEVPDVRVSTANGRDFVEKTLEIMRYLAATRSVPMPH